MLLIRREQIARFDAEAEKVLVARMVQHLGTFAPRHSQVIGREKLEIVAATGIARARTYGFTVMGPIQFFVEMMSMFGSWFDTDPQYPWVAEILASDRYADQISRSEALWERTVAYLDAVAGPDNAYSIAALKNIDSLRERFEANPAILKGMDLVDLFGTVYPQKASHLGETALRTLVAAAKADVAAYGATTDRSVALWVCMAFAMGHGFTRDPLHPWVASALHDTPDRDSERCARHLYHRATVYLRSAIRYLETRN
jgi:hypothetical protein